MNSLSFGLKLSQRRTAVIASVSDSSVKKSFAKRLISSKLVHKFKPHRNGRK